MEKKLYLVYQDDAANSSVELGIYTNRKKALDIFHQKVAETIGDDHGIGLEVFWVHDQDHRKEVTIIDQGNGWTWYFKAVQTNNLLTII